MRPPAEVVIRSNRWIHDEVAAFYEHKHTEIFNPTEQARISAIIARALSEIDTGADIPTVLDFGAGTGNLSMHLLQQGASVIAADISLQSLQLLQDRCGNAEKLQLMELNGEDLGALADNSVDMVATYSVLHHVPDYLAAVREFARVVKPGGVIYIDHEAAPHVWDPPSDAYRRYRQKLAALEGRSFWTAVWRKFTNIFYITAWKRLFNRSVYGIGNEGDIHVTQEDHIEWQLIEKILDEDCTLIGKEDYLVCRERASSPEFHARYADKCSDMRWTMCRKRAL